MKARFTRKNYIFFGILFFIQAFIVIAGAGIDYNNFLFPKDNIIGQFTANIKLPRVDADMKAWFTLIAFCVYAYIFCVAFVYETRLAKYYDNRIWTWKWASRYLVTFLIGLVLWGGISLVAHLPLRTSEVWNSFKFCVSSIIVGLIASLALAFIIGSIALIVVNFKNIDKPFRFFDIDTSEDDSYIEDAEEEEALAEAEKSGLADVIKKQEDAAYAGGGGAGYGSGNGRMVAQQATLITDKKIVFPGLCTIDSEEIENSHEVYEDTNYTLKELVEAFRNYLAKEEKLYFNIQKLRAFVAGLSVSRLLILEGLSGTGKSSLARYFSTFIGEKSYFESVQASWHDRTALLGFYNDFAKKYNETEFLKRLYRMNYRTEDVNIMVLDEVNISRVEYYFADFLSVMEYPMEDWKLKIMELPQGFEAPTMLKDGFVSIPKNTWFIGTANKDESTYAITDKVYDRAIIISFDDRNTPFDVNDEVETIHLSYDGLWKLFDDARSEINYNLSPEDIRKFQKITEFVYDTFDIAFGNRIWNQIVNMVPVYVALGGTKEEALDFMFARKYLYKLDGRFEDFIKQGLIDLQGLIERTYGEHSFEETHKIIKNMIRKL